MAKKRRQTKIPTPAWEQPRGGAIGRRLLGRSSQFYGLVVVVVLVAIALGVVGYAFWEEEAEKRGRPGSTAVQVEDTSYRLDYFSARLAMYVDQVGGQSSTAGQAGAALPAVAEQLIREEIIRSFADEFDLSADAAEIKVETATRLGITADDESYDTVYEQELARSGLTDEQYREMIEAAVLSNELQEHFRAELPDTAEAVNYRQILVATQEDADSIVANLEGGADFAALAAESSLDANTKDSGGEVGWTPKGASPLLDDTLFSVEVGELATVPVQNGVIVVEVTEKDEAYALEAADKTNLSATALSEWIDEKRTSVAIVNNMDLASGDPDKIRWAVDRVYES